jgi:hypothetical protein
MQTRRSRKSPPSPLPAEPALLPTPESISLLPDQFTEPSSPTDASGIVSHCSSTDISTLTPVPTSSDEWSTKAQAGESAPREPLQFNYSEVDFKKIPGFTIPRSYSTAQLRSSIWKLSVPTEEQDTMYTLTSKRPFQNAPRSYAVGCRLYRA